MGSISIIDCNYLMPQYAASFLMKEGREALFVENNTAMAVPRLLGKLEEEGLSPDDVKYLIVTHVHLDHSGGTALLLSHCPNAKVLAHPRAAEHLIDPARLVLSAKAVYGEDTFTRLYGRIDPVPGEKVVPVQDNEIISFGNSELTFIHTRGHAGHHMCIYDSATNSIFTGDTFGLAYPILQKGGRDFIFPSASPPSFDPVLLKESVSKIVKSGADRAWLTHFGTVELNDENVRSFLDEISFLENLIIEADNSGLEEAPLLTFCLNKIQQHFISELRARGLDYTESITVCLKPDTLLNAQGIASAVSKKRSS